MAPIASSSPWRPPPAADVLSALLLLRQAGLFRLDAAGRWSTDVEIVPLFETIGDLARAPQVLVDLLRFPAFRTYVDARA